MRVAQTAGDLAAAKKLLVLTLLWTGARVSEVLSIRVRDIDLAEGLVAVRTLKRRRPHVREVPLPRALLEELAATFDLQNAKRDPDHYNKRIFPWSRSTVWRLIKQLCEQASITGVAAAPKGMRHGFGVGTLQAGVPLTLVQRWLGHARLTTTAIYTEVLGPEEMTFAEQFWSWRPPGPGSQRR